MLKFFLKIGIAMVIIYSIYTCTSHFIGTPGFYTGYGAGLLVAIILGIVDRIGE